MSHREPEFPTESRVMPKKYICCKTEEPEPKISFMRSHCMNSVDDSPSSTGYTYYRSPDRSPGLKWKYNYVNKKQGSEQAKLIKAEDEWGCTFYQGKMNF